LKKRLSNDFGFDVTLKYDDHEGDLITLSSQNDLDVIFAEEHENVNVIVTENLLPNVHGKKSNRVTSIWSNTQNSTLEWGKNPPGNLGHSLNNSHCPSPITFSSSNLQPLRPISKFDRFPIIDSSSPRFMEKPTRWKKGEILGQGAFGVVCLGLNIETGELMAVKQMTLDDKKELSSLENEINMLRSLRHPNIVRYIGTEATPSTLSIFLEYVPGGSLKSLIDKFGKLEESVARSYTRQLLLGLEYLHRNGIAHRDVKGANCLVGNDGAIKLADFGASKQWRPQVSVEEIQSTATAMTGNLVERSESGSHEVRGTPSWMAPEVIRNDQKHLNWKKADVWSLGCTTIEMTTGRSPWAQFTNPVTVLYHIACSDSLPEYPETPSVELLTFLNTCLQRDSVHRPDITSLLLHPFVANAGSFPSNSQGGGTFGYRPSTVSTTPSMGDWERESLLSATWKTSTSRSVLGRGDQQQDAGAFIPERDPVPHIPIAPSLGIKHSPRYGDEQAQSRKNSPRDSNYEIHPPVGNPDLDLEATAPRNVVDNALRTYTRESSLSPLTLAEKYPAHDPHSLENSLETSDLEDSSNTFESSRILTQPSSDDDNTIPSTNSNSTYTKIVPTAASRRRTGRSSHHQEDIPPRIPEGDEIKTARGRSSIPSLVPPPAAVAPLLATKDEILYSAESLLDPSNGNNGISIERKKSKNREGRERRGSSKKMAIMAARAGEGAGGETTATVMDKEMISKTNSRKKVEKLLNPISVSPNSALASITTVRSEEVATPPRRTASVVSISGSPSNLDSPKSTRKANQPKNRLEVLENEPSGAASGSSSSKQPSRRPFDYPPNLSNNEIPNSSNKSSAKSTPRSGLDHSATHTATESSSALLKSWRSDKSGGAALIEDEIENQKELSDRLFSLRTCTDEIHDESSEVYEDIYHSEDDLPAAELSDDYDCCEVLESSLTHLSDDDVVDFTTKDFTAQNSLTTSDGDWMIGQEAAGTGGGGGMGGGSVLEMSVLKEENSKLRIDGGRTPTSLHSSSDETMRKSRGQWAGTSAKAKKIENGNGDGLTMSPSMPSLEIVRNKIEGYTLVGHSLGNQTLGTPKTDIRFHKQSTGSGSISKTSSSKLLHRGGGTVGNTSSRRSLEISGDSIDLRLSGANTANAGLRRPRDSLEMSSRGGEMQMPSSAAVAVSTSQDGLLRQLHGEGARCGEVDDDSDVYGDEESQMEDSLNAVSNATLNPTAEILDEHTAGVTKLRLNSRKRLLFSASFDGTIRIWSSKGSDIGSDTTKAKMVLDVAAFAKLPNGTGTASGTLVRKPSGNRNAATTPTRPIRATGLWVDNSCDTVWGGYSDGVVRVWVADGRPMRALKGHEELVTCVEGCDTAVSSALGSPHVSSTGSLDKTVRVWDIRSKKAQVALFRGHNDSILSMKWIDSGRCLVTASKDRSIKIWDFRSGRLVTFFSYLLTLLLTPALRLRTSLDKHFGSVNIIKALPIQTTTQSQSQDGSSLPSFLSGARDGMINSWTSEGNCLGSQGAHRNSVNCMSEIHSFLSGGGGLEQQQQVLITGGADNLIKVWDVKRLKLLSQFTCGNVVKVAWFHTKVVVGTSTGQMMLWDPSSSSSSADTSSSSLFSASTQWTSKELTTHSQMCTDIVSNQHCAISSAKSGQIYRWSVQ
jgi:serine/threonine protein kinase/WD40 repeat protein